MDRHRSFPASLLFAACLWSAGCGWWGAHSDSGVEEDFADSADDPVTVAPAAATAEGAPAQFERRRPGGDRFPLLKTVSAVLQQASPQGWVTRRSTLEMPNTLTLEEVHQSDHQQPEFDPRSGQKRWQVTYHRLRFS